MNRLLIFLLLIFISPVQELCSQRMESWKEKRETDHFIEGTYSLPVSSSINLISFHSYFHPFEIGKKQELFFEVINPESDNYLLKVQERKIVDYYMLESKPGKIDKGLVKLGPWKVDDFLESLKIPASNLAVVCRLKEDDSKYVLPVTVRENKKNKKVDNYKAIFRLSKSIRKGEYSVYLGEHSGIAPKSKMVYQGKFGRQTGGGTLQISIDKKKLKDYKGWVTVKLSMSPKQSLKKIPYTFYFYHSPS